MKKHASNTTNGAPPSNTNPAPALTPQQVSLTINTAVGSLIGIQGPMTLEQVRALPKVPAAGLPLVLAEANTAVQHPGAVPPTIDPVAMQASYARLQALRILQEDNLLNQRRIDATIIQEEAALWSQGLNLYAFFQRQQKQEPELIPVVEKMTAFLAKGPRVPKPKEPAAPASPSASTSPAGNGSTASAGSAGSNGSSSSSNGSSSGSNGSSSASTVNEPVTVYGPSGVVGTSEPTNVPSGSSSNTSGNSSHG